MIPVNLKNAIWVEKRYQYGASVHSGALPGDSQSPGSAPE
jgi:hypothetical protein